MLNRNVGIDIVQEIGGVKNLADANKVFEANLDSVVGGSAEDAGFGGKANDCYHVSSPCG